MEFIRSDLGIENRDLFYFPKILVYVEGQTDFPFYAEVLRNYNYHLKAQGGKEEGKKLANALIGKDLPYVVVLDGDYGILDSTRSKHRRVVILHRYSFENYLFEKEPIEQFCRDHQSSENRLKKLENNFSTYLEEIKQKLEELIILDVAHQRAETGFDVLPEKSDRFFKSQKTVDFLDSQIEQYTQQAKNINKQAVEDAKTMVKQYVKQRRFVDLLPGHFVVGIMRRLIVHTAGKNISNEEIIIYLSREVWQLVKTRDHDSLKRRLRNAVREAERIRKVSSN